MARKKRGDDGGGYSWMDTYGDMVTLLLTFFVMLFASSSVDAEKFEILVKAFSTTPMAATAQIVPEGEGQEAMPAAGTGELPGREIDVDNTLPVDLNQLYEYLKRYIEENNMSGSVRIEKGANNTVYLRFDNNIFFDGNSSVLRPSSYDILDFMGDCFKSVEGQILFIRINGHTASIQGSLVNDWDLSSSRANRVASYFESAKEFDPTKLMTQGYGKNHPIATNDTEEGRSKNRRVDIMVLGNEFDTGNAEEVYDVLQKLMNADMFDDKANASDIVVPETNGTASAAEPPAESPSAADSTPSAANVTPPASAAPVR